MTLTDRQKKLAAAGVGGLLFLVFMLSRARNAANTAPAATTVPTAVPGGAGQADFSGDAGGGASGTDFAGALSGIQSSLDTIGSNQGILYDQNTDLGTSVGGLTTGQATQQASIDNIGAGLSAFTDRVPATDGTPGPAATPTRAASPAKQSVKAAVKPKTVVKGGQVYHYYDTDPKKKGYERKVHVRPASTPKRSPSQHPKAHAAPVRAKPKTHKTTIKRKSRR